MSPTNPEASVEIRKAVYENPPGRQKSAPENLDDEQDRLPVREPERVVPQQHFDRQAEGPVIVEGEIPDRVDEDGARHPCQPQQSREQ